jgi:hypothetical protein
MPLSNYEKKRRLDACWATAAYSKPATVYFGLFTSAPNAGGGGVECVIGTNAYARASVDTVDANFTAPLGSPCTNATAIAFPAPTGAWGSGNPITHWAAFDASTAGNMIEYGTLSSALTISGAGTAPTIPIGGLVLDSL